MRVFSELTALPPFTNTVITIGSFDGVHTGHRRILEQVRSLARACGGESVVITFEPHPRAVLRPGDPDLKLITTTREKLRLLEKYGADHTVLAPFSLEFAQQSAQTYVEDFLIRHFHPRYIVIGYDHRFGHNREGDLAFLRRYEARHGFEVVEIPAQEIDAIAVSSSKIRQALEAADVRRANRLLGHAFFFNGRVIEGDQIGRTIGFPTANLRIEDPHKLVPPAGIYAARAEARGERYDAMLYIGDRPTLQTRRGRTIEVNLLGFDGELYGEELHVDVLDFIRADRRLESLEALRLQIEADKREIVARLAGLAATETAAPEVGPVPPAAEIAAAGTPEPGAGVIDRATGPGLRIAVVILSYNTRRHLEQFLPSVVAHSAGARIIVADNGSPDDSVAFLHTHYPGIEVLDLGQNYGFAQGYNEALRQVDADYYVVLNSDVEVTPGWIEPVVAALEADRSIAIAQPKILGWPAKTHFEYAGAAGGWIDALGYPFCRGRIFNELERDRGQYDTPQSCFWAAGAAFFIRAERYHTFGGFDGTYFAHNEEIDLCWRVKRAGYGVWCVPQSVVYHLGGGTLEYENPRKVFLNFRNSLLTLLKNERPAALPWVLSARFILDGVAALRFVAKRQFGAVRAIWRAHFSFYRLFGATLRKRRALVDLVERQRIGPENRDGRLGGSIVFRHYAQRIKHFNELWNRK
jgi:riboflavin kinase/FMN adenylyltransferase